MPTAPVVPNRVRNAAAAAPSAANMSRHGPPPPVGADMPGNTAIAAAVNTFRAASNRDDMRRSQPRTVPAGTRRPAAMGRNPEPAALATSAAITVAAAYPRLANKSTGSNTCETLHERHRARRGRTGAAPSIRRGRAHPHGPKTPGHTGHDSRPPESRDSTETASTSTVTNGCLRASSTALPQTVHPERRREGRGP